MFKQKLGLQYKPGIQIICTNRSWGLLLENKKTFAVDYYCPEFRSYVITVE